jgi:hypothetical protein
MTFLSELAANATKNNVALVFYSGNDDALVAHRSTEGWFSLFLLLFRYLTPVTPVVIQV